MYRLTRGYHSATFSFFVRKDRDSVDRARYSWGPEQAIYGTWHELRVGLGVLLWPDEFEFVAGGEHGPFVDEVLVAVVRELEGDA